MISKKINAFLKLSTLLNYKILLSLFQKLGYRTGLLFLWIILLPISIIIHYFTCIRFVPIITQHIGHLTLQPHILLCLKKEEKYFKNTFILLTNSKVANYELLNRWKEFFKVINNSILVFILKSLSLIYFSKFNVHKYDAMMFNAQPVYKLISHNKNNFFIKLSKEDKKKLNNLKKELFIRKYKFYVCIHSRTPYEFPLNEHYQAHRNVNIETYKEAIDFIKSQGGVCVLMGSNKITLDYDGVINYSSSKHKNELNDILLASNCLFFLGCTSGLSFLAGIFNRPIAHTNMIPLSTLGIFKNDLSINKILKKNGKIIKFRDLVRMKPFNYFYTYQYNDQKIDIVDNNSFEILLLVKDMFKILNKEDFSYQEKLLMMNIKKHFTKNDFAFGSIANISPSFIKYRKDYFE